MIDMEYIRGFYPPYIAQNAAFQKHMLKEYVELLALEWIARSPYATKLIFIGGTNLRLIHGIDRFSEDLDFDCKRLSAALLSFRKSKPSLPFKTSMTTSKRISNYELRHPVIPRNKNGS